MSNYTAVSTGVWLLLLMFLLRRWRLHRIDALRQTLFSLRDELFDFAANGGIAFDAPAYLVSRSSINSLIRFAHRITASRFVLLLVGKRLKWYTAEVFLRPVYELPAGEAKTKIIDLHARVLFAVAIHFLTTSPSMCACLALFVLHLLVKGAARKTTDIITAFTKHISVDLIESMAVEIDSGLAS
jgi:hypothetical protein